MIWILLLLLVGCEQKPQEMVKLSGVAMTIPYEVIIGSSLSQGQQEEVEGVIRGVFAEIDQTFNDWNPGSEVNHLGEKEPSVTMTRFLARIGEWVKITGGRFDPTVGELARYWKVELREGRYPEKERLEALERQVGWGRDGATLDLGGVAKGLAVDWMVERLEARGYRSVWVEWGGEIRVAGGHPTGRPWRILLKGVKEEVVELVDGAVATSGDELQAWDVEVEGENVTLFHIVDPRTKQPLRVRDGSVGSVTVVAETCAEADALATAGMVFEDVEEGREWARRVGKDVRFGVRRR